jgi:hypothetical protein
MLFAIIPEILNRTSSQKDKVMRIKKPPPVLSKGGLFPKLVKILSSDDRQCRALRHTSVGCGDRRIDLFIGWYRGDVDVAELAPGPRVAAEVRM